MDAGKGATCAKPPIRGGGAGDEACNMIATTIPISSGQTARGETPHRCGVSEVSRVAIVIKMTVTRMDTNGHE